jgi:hypothetical protein
MNAKKTDHLKNWFPNTPTGYGLFRLAFDMTMSRNEPLGHRFQHQYLPLNTARTRKNAIMPTTR